MIYFEETRVLLWDSIQLDERSTIVEDPVVVLDTYVRRVRSKDILVVRVQWKHHLIEEATWVIEHEIRVQYPHMFKP